MARRGFAIIFTFLGAALVVSIAGFALLYFLVGREPAVPRQSVLVLRVGGDLAEVAGTDVVGYLRGAKTPTVRSIVDNLRKAKVDARVQSVLLKPTGFDSPFWGKIQEIRDAVLDFKKSGKPVYAYLEYGGDREYYLATAADKIFLMPSASLDLSGVATYAAVPARHARQARRRIPTCTTSATTRPRPTSSPKRATPPAHREMDQSLNRDLYDQLVRGIADGRKKNEAEVRALIDDGPFLPEDALRAGLVDDVAYEDQVDEKLGNAPARAAPRRRRLRAHQRRLARPEPRAAHRRHLRVGHHQQRQERLRSGQRRDRRLRDAERLHPPGAARQLGARDRAAHRQPRRIGVGVRRDLARADDRAQRARRSSARRLDVGPRGVGRLLHRDARAGDRRAAVDADRLDRHLRRQVRHRRRLRKARRPHRVDEHRPPRRDRTRRRGPTTPRS